MHETKQGLSYHTSENEKKYFQRLVLNITVVHDIIMNKVIQLMKTEMPSMIEDFILRAGYDKSEIDKIRISYLTLMSSFIREDSEKILCYKSRFKFSENDNVSSVNHNNNMYII